MNLRSLPIYILPIAFLAACVEPQSSFDQPQVSEGDPDINFVRNYRSGTDTCQLVGESAFTVEFLDDSSDLVACDTGTPDSESLNAMANSRVVTQTNSYTFFSVSRR